MKKENLTPEKFIPPAFYSLEGLYEIINTLENSPEVKEFSGVALWATRKQSKVAIDKNFIEKLRLTAEHYQESLGEERCQEILARIIKLEQRFNK